jgi:hypothetical protein
MSMNECYGRFSRAIEPLWDVLSPLRRVVDDFGATFVRPRAGGARGA